uniref:Proline-rich extensin-like protein EPR1 n=1 Tax=Cicer arietinum TaxID=3827 RepID=A0A3Q7YCP4_CICAR|nr:proline-rich extensin-like protein EPR1 [Cicer arietinum]
MDLPEFVTPSILPLEPITYVPPEAPPISPPVVPLQTPLVDPPTIQPLQTYCCRQPPSIIHVPTPVLDTEVIPNAPSPPPSPLSDPTFDIPIAIRKGIRPTLNPSPHYVGLSYNRFSHLHYICLSSLSSIFIPKSPGEALSHLEWRQPMIDEMCALQSNGTWKLVPLPSGKSLVGCR